MSVVLDAQRRTRPRSRLARLLGVSPLTPDAVSWYRGAVGEIAVGKVLTRLGNGWVVLHSVPVGARDADIDHVLIGRAGVVTVNTKNHAGQKLWVADRAFLVAGQEQKHIPNALHEAERAGKLLGRGTGGAPPTVRPAVVVIDPKQLMVRERPAVAVLRHRELVRWLGRLPDVLSQEEVDRLVDVAVRPSTWRTAAPVEPTDPAALQQEFAQVRRQVRGARRVRTAWAAGAYGSVVASALTVGPELLSGVARGLLP